MRIGLDFDNTIVRYDTLFHRVAKEQGLIPDHIPQDKSKVRDHIRSIGREPEWTAMQGEVYGARMDEADAFPGVVAAMSHVLERGHELVIISHKTLHPIIGPKHDLRAAARRWIDTNLVVSGAGLFASHAVYFEGTKEEKLARIEVCGCEIFLDDLPEILGAPGFPRQTRGILFDPFGNHAHPERDSVASWDDFAELLEAL